MNNNNSNTAAKSSYTTANAASSSKRKNAAASGSGSSPVTETTTSAKTPSPTSPTGSGSVKKQQQQHHHHHHGNTKYQHQHSYQQQQQQQVAASVDEGQVVADDHDFINRFKTDQQQAVNTTSAVMRERLTFLLLNFIGQLVEVVSVNGKIFEGLFHTAYVRERNSPTTVRIVRANYPDDYEDEGRITSLDKLDDNFVVVLKGARIKNTKQQMPQFPMDTFVIKGRDIAQLYAADVIFASEKQQYRDESFMTDTEISRREFVERELVPWSPMGEGGDGDGNGGDWGDAADWGDGGDDSMNMALEDRNYRPGAWDQFRTNEQKFGVKTTYDERMYTTELDKSSKFYLENVRYAEQLAREIEGQTADNIHLREERGQSVAHVSEEELYSSVIRDESGRYVPPHQRHLQQQMQKQQQQKSQKQPASIAATAASKQSAAAAASPAAKTATTVASAPTPTDVAEREKDALLQQKLVERIGKIDLIETSPRRNSYATSMDTSTGASASSPLSPGIEQYKQIRQTLIKPKASPSISPIAPPKSPMALNLDLGSPRVTEDVVAEYQKFMATENAKKVQNKHVEISRLREFSEKMTHKLPKSAVAAGGASGSVLEKLMQQHTRTRTDSAPVSLSSGLAKAQPIITAADASKENVAAKTAQPITTKHSGPPGAAAASDKITTAATTTATKPAPSATPTEKQLAAPTTKAPAKLNASAKPFVFNPKVASFVPTAPSSSAPTPSVATTVPKHVPYGFSASENLRIPLSKLVRNECASLIDDRMRASKLENPTTVPLEWLPTRKTRIGGPHRSGMPHQGGQQQQHMAASGQAMDGSGMAPMMYNPAMTPYGMEAMQFHHHPHHPGFPNPMYGAPPGPYGVPPHNPVFDVDQYAAQSMYHHPAQSYVDPSSGSMHYHPPPQQHPPHHHPHHPHQQQQHHHHEQQ